MKDSKALPRPPQVTMAGWVAIVGSVFVVLGVWEVVANLRSLETRDGVEKMLSEAPMDGTGIGVEQWLSILHTVSLVAAACATAAAILGWHVLQRSRAARVGLSVVAVPLFLTGLFSGAFVSSMVAVAAALLWTKPARDWFNGIAPAPARRAQTWPPGSSSRPPAPPASQDQPPAPPSGDLPPPSGPSYPLPPPGTTSPGSTLPPPPGWPPSPGASGQPRNTAYSDRQTFSTARPTELVQACVVTWICAGLVLLGSAIVVLAFVADPSLAREIYEQDSRVADAGLTPSTVRTSLIVACSVFAVWSLLAIGLAVAAFLGRSWARISLVVSAALSSFVCLMGAVSSPVMVLPALAGAAAAFLLLRPQVRDWFTDRF